MIAKKTLTYLEGTIILILLTLGCKEGKVTITKDYVINPNWIKGDNHFGISRMLLKDSSRTIELKDAAEMELYQQNTWYLLSGLSQIHTTMYYVYLDTSDCLHVFKVSTMANY